MVDASRSSAVPAGMATARLDLAAPLDIPGSLGGLQRWGDDLIDRWDGRRWLRVLRIAGRSVPARARAAGSIAAPVLEITASATDLVAVAERVAASFVTVDAGLLAALAAADPAVAAADARFPGIRPLLTFETFDALVRSISAQQVNLRWAAEVRRRLAVRYGTRHEIEGEPVMALDAAAIADASVEELRALQLTTVKAKAVIAAARSVLDGGLDRADLAALEDEAVIERLTALFGIGRWSAEWFLARTLGRPTVVAGDLGVRKAVGRAYFGGRMPSEAEVRAATAHWGAAAGVAQQLLLNTLLAA
jgi:DNA-3-methyladenine glycosylase II